MRQIIEAAVAPLNATASIAGGAAGSAAQPATMLRPVLRGATPRVSGQRFSLRGLPKRISGAGAAACYCSRVHRSIKQSKKAQARARRSVDYWNESLSPKAACRTRRTCCTFNGQKLVTTVLNSLSAAARSHWSPGPWQSTAQHIPLRFACDRASVEITARAIFAATDGGESQSWRESVCYVEGPAVPSCDPRHWHGRPS